MDFTSLTGEGVKIAIIDSGLSPDASDLWYKKAGGVSISAANRDIRYGTAIADSFGHGTACAGIISHIAPKALLFPVKIFINEPKASARVLLEAIQWCIEQQMQVVNLSLGTISESSRELLEGACEQAAKNGVLLVAALNSQTLSYPAQFKTVIPVAGGMMLHRYSYGFCPPRLFLGRGEPQRVRWLGGGRIFMGGSSLAAAQISAISALLIEKFDITCLDDICKALINHKSECGATCFRIPNSQNKGFAGKPNHDIIKRVSEIIKRFGINYNEGEALFNQLNPVTAARLLDAIELEFAIEIDDWSLSLKTLESVDSLALYIEEGLAGVT
ncbi:MAG: S8 family serine peptidase [Bacillota bacterium]